MGGKELWKEIVIVILVIVEILILEIITNKIIKNKMKKILEQIVEILVKTNKVVNCSLAISYTSNSVRF